MSNSINKASEEVNRETRKLEARLNEFLADEAIFVKSLKECIDKLKSLYGSIEKMELNPNTKKLDEIIRLKEESEKAFSYAVTKQGKAEHEKSHLLESYGALFLALQSLGKEIKS